MLLEKVKAIERIIIERAQYFRASQMNFEKPNLILRLYHRIMFYLAECCQVGAVAQSVERATPSDEVPGSIPAVAARSLLIGSVSV